MPSRGRASQAARTISKGRRLSVLTTDYVVAADNDDPSLYEYTQLTRNSVAVYNGPRANLVTWTNFIARQAAPHYKYLASFGDDHVPCSQGWDELLTDAILNMGGTGFAYPDDKRRQDIPEAVVISSNIVQALGWMMLPTLRHFCVDNVWADLGQGAGCIRFVPEVQMPHFHYTVDSQVERDRTYADAEEQERDRGDEYAYNAWRINQMESDIQTIRALRE